MNSRPPPAAATTPKPVRLERYDEPPVVPTKQYWLHPASGLLILAVDWLLFAPEAATGGIAVLISSPLAFLITTTGVFLIQRRRNQDSFRGALLKALLGGIVAAIPTSIGGTILGTFVLVLSGLSSWNHRRGQ